MSRRNHAIIRRTGVAFCIAAKKKKSSVRDEINTIWRVSRREKKKEPRENERDVALYFDCIFFSLFVLRATLNLERYRIVGKRDR